MQRNAADATALRPEDAHPHLLFAVVYARLAAERLAWVRANRALRPQPDLAGALVLLGELHVRRQEWRQAVALWRWAPFRGQRYPC